jgi:hypothetical protein
MMPQLILIDKDSQQEVGRREMHASERYDIYAAWDTGDLLSFQAKQYTLHTVAWRVPENNCVVQVTFHSWVTDGGCC